MLESCRLYLTPGGHLIVESLVAHVHESLAGYRAHDTQRHIPVGHDYVPIHEFQQGLGFTSYPHWLPTCDEPQ